MAKKTITEQRIKACQIEINKLEKKKVKYQKNIDNKYASENTKEFYQNKIDKLDEKIKKNQDYIDDPSVVDDMIQKNIDKSIFTKAGNSLTKGGESLQKTGKKVTKVGAHATGIVWTPVLYGGYQVIKKKRKDKKEKNFQEDVRFYKETRGADSVLVGLVQECEEAYNDGKIDKEELKHFINDYIDNML